MDYGPKCSKLYQNKYQSIDWFYKNSSFRSHQKICKLTYAFPSAQDVHLPKFQIIIFTFFVSVIEKRQEISTFLTYYSYKNEWLLDKFCFKCLNSRQHHILMAYYFDQFGKHKTIFYTCYNFLLRQKWHWNGFEMDLEHMKHFKFNCVLNWLHLRRWCSAILALVTKVAEQ